MFELSLRRLPRFQNLCPACRAELGDPFARYQPTSGGALFPANICPNGHLVLVPIKVLTPDAEEREHFGCAPACALPLDLS